MINTLLSDLAYVLLFPKEKTYHGTLNGLYKDLQQKTPYRFFDYYEIDQNLLKLYRNYKEKGLSVNIFTSGSLQENPEIKPELLKVFENIYSASFLNISKSDPVAYTKICSLLGKKPEEVVFIDDQLANVEAAREAGLNFIYYQSIEQTERALAELIPSTPSAQN